MFDSFPLEGKCSKWQTRRTTAAGKDFAETIFVAEKRKHGVGFYDFAKDEESRQEQLKAFSQLRNQVRSSWRFSFSTHQIS